MGLPGAAIIDVQHHGAAMVEGEMPLQLRAPGVLAGGGARAASSSAL